MSTNIRIMDANGAVCIQPVEINVKPGCDGVDWIGDPTIQCRPRIAGYHNGMITIAAPCLAGGSIPWDGTFSVRTTPALPTPVQYSSVGLPFDEISGFHWNVPPLVSPTLTYNSTLVRWRLVLTCSNGSFYIASLFNVSPIGIYVPTTDIFANGNLQIEAYHL